MEKNKWLTSKEVMQKWGINKPTLADYIYTRKLKARSLSEEWGRSSVLGSLRLTPAGRIYLPVTLQGKIWSIGNIIKNLDDFIFFLQDVLEFETGKNLKIEKEESQPKDETSKEEIKRFEVEKPLTGYKEIGKFLGVKAETVEKKYKPSGAPIRLDRESRRVWAYPSELLEWKEKRSLKNRRNRRGE